MSHLTDVLHSLDTGTVGRRLASSWTSLPLPALPRMETTSEFNKSPTHPVLYKVLALMNLYINVLLYQLFQAYLWMGQGMGGPFSFQNLGFLVLGDAIGLSRS